ncbi:MAG: hypothetical protein QOD63_2361 [Actinomycetota bacterium]|nr:hypothetical protein [Actinomycetota bacterium]
MIVRRWWLLALLVAGAAAAVSGAGGATSVGTGAHRFASEVTADATLGAVAVQAAVLPWRGEESLSTLTRAEPERAPMLPAAVLAVLAAIPGMARCRSRRRHAGPASTLVALRRVVALRAPPCLRLA